MSIEFVLNTFKRFVWLYPALLFFSASIYSAFYFASFGLSLSVALTPSNLISVVSNDYQFLDIGVFSGLAIVTFAYSMALKTELCDCVRTALALLVVVVFIFVSKTSLDLGKKSAQSIIVNDGRCATNPQCKRIFDVVTKQGEIFEKVFIILLSRESVIFFKDGETFIFNQENIRYIKSVKPLVINGVTFQ